MSQLAIISLISLWSGVFGIDPNVAISVAKQESSLNPKATGSQGEIGLFQVKPQFVKNYTKEQLMDPQTNIIVGIQKLKEAQRTCVHKKDIQWLICYNYGRTNAKHVRHPSLFPYVLAVKKLIIATNEDKYGQN